MLMLRLTDSSLAQRLPDTQLTTSTGHLLSTINLVGEAMMTDFIKIYHNNIIILKRTSTAASFVVQRLSELVLPYISGVDATSINTVP